MRFVIGLFVLLAILAACTTPGEGVPPLAQQTLGDEIEQISISSDLFRSGVHDDYRGPDEDNYIQIAARIGVSACGIGATEDAIGRCDIPEELLCNPDGTRICQQDCMDYLNGDGSCLVDWMIANYDDITSGTAQHNRCFETRSDYNEALASTFCTGLTAPGDAGESESCEDDIRIGNLYCLNGHVHEIVCVGGTSLTNTRHETCEHGCSSGACNPTPESGSTPGTTFDQCYSDCISGNTPDQCTILCTLE